jgi:hypothetical protein
VPHDVRDLVVDFVRRWSEKAEIIQANVVESYAVTCSLDRN